MSNELTLKEIMVARRSIQESARRNRQPLEKVLNEMRKGIAEAMLRYALRALGKSGMEKAILTVYGTNLPACSLYLKLGYELRSVLIEMQYTTDMRELDYRKIK